MSKLNTEPVRQSVNAARHERQGAQKKIDVEMPEVRTGVRAAVAVSRLRQVYGRGLFVGKESGRRRFVRAFGNRGEKISGSKYLTGEISNYFSRARELFDGRRFWQRNSWIRVSAARHAEAVFQKNCGCVQPAPCAPISHHGCSDLAR